jgi:hypothetical protein
MTGEAAMDEHEHEHDSREHHDAESADSAGTASGRDGTAAQETTAPAPHARLGRPRGLAAGLIWAIGATVFSVVFIASFVGALHDPGPRSVPIGFVGSPTQASALSGALDRADPGAFVVTAYPDASSARDAILDRKIDAALVTSPPQLIVATAVGEAVTTATVKVFTSAANSAGVNLPTPDIRPLHRSDPQGLSQVFFVVALLAPSVIFGNALIKDVSRGLHPFWHLVVIAVYAAIVAAVATAIADAAIGALIGAPWGLFGIGTLFAFAVAVVGAAVTRWVGSVGYVIIVMLFIPIGISSSGTTLGPNMITPWYADLGKALPPGSALPAVQNTIYFNGNAIAKPLLILSAWALAGIIAFALVAVFHPPLPRQPAFAATADHPAASAADNEAEDVHVRADASTDSGRTSTPKPN